MINKNEKLNRIKQQKKTKAKKTRKDEKKGGKFVKKELTRRRIISKTFIRNRFNKCFHLINMNR